MDPEIAEVLEIMMPILVLYSGIIIVALVVGLTRYILRGIAIYKLSAQQNIPNGWLGFIPYAKDYQLGTIAGEIEFGNKKIQNTGLWLVLMPILYGLAFFIGYMIMMVPFIMQTIALGNNPHPQEFANMMTTFVVSFVVFILILLVGQVFLYLFKCLALHKIFAARNEGQKPVFYLVLCLFAPLAEEILLFQQSKKPLLNAPVAPAAPAEATDWA